MFPGLHQQHREPDRSRYIPPRPSASQAVKAESQRAAVPPEVKRFRRQRALIWLAGCALIALLFAGQAFAAASDWYSLDGFTWAHKSRWGITQTKGGAFAWARIKQALAANQPGNEYDAAVARSSCKSGRGQLMVSKPGREAYGPAGAFDIKGNGERDLIARDICTNADGVKWGGLK